MTYLTGFNLTRSAIAMTDVFFFENMVLIETDYYLSVLQVRVIRDKEPVAIELKTRYLQLDSARMSTPGVMSSNNHNLPINICSPFNYHHVAHQGSQR